MTEEQVKLLGRWLVDNSNRPLTAFEKKLLKQAIDRSNNIQEMISILIVMLGLH